MIYTQFLGIYDNEVNVQCAIYHVLLPGILPGKKGVFKKRTFSNENLKKILDQLKPSRSRKIFVALPRNLFFTRRIQFPDLPLDDIRDAVINSLATYAHLPRNEIYYDVLFSKKSDKQVNALLYYAPRKKLDRYFTLFRETGHIKSLEGIFPFSYGAGPWYVKDDKNALVIQYPDAMELALYTGSYCVNSILLDVSDNGHDPDQLIQEILADHGMESGQVRQVDGRVPEHNTIVKTGRVDENLGNVAIAPVIHDMQRVHVDENPPRIKLFKPMKLLLPVFVILAVVMISMTFDIQNDIRDRQAALSKLEQQIDGLTREIAPILEAKEALNKAAGYKEDVEDFVASQPPLYTYINDLARIVPENTWFAHLSYKPGIISVQGEGDDVLKVVEALRNSGKYKEVKLQGSVSRTQQGKDNFRIDLIFKEPLDLIEGRDK